MRLNMNMKIVTFLIATSVMASAETYQQRLADSTTVLHEMSQASDKGIPQDLLQKAQCVVVVPGLKKVAFVGGGKYGRGYASCLTKKGWSGPAAVRIEGGSFGLQLGASSTDVIMLILNDGGMQKLLSDKFTLGGEAAAAAGPVGRNTSANTDVLMKAEILSWSRSRGVFAGLSLEGATLRQDEDENAKLYGKPLTNKEILTGTVKRPVTAGPFLAQLQRFSGKGASPAVIPAKSHQPSSPKSDQATMAAATPPSNTAPDADDTAKNQSDQAASATTADQQGNGKTDLQLTASIRRSIVSDGSLSTYAHNVKIVVQNGVATLKGPVRTQEEKAAIEAKAAAVVGQDHVVDQMEISPQGD
jgi:lipid-binding SYLF domain-containing protein